MTPVISVAAERRYLGSPVRQRWDRTIAYKKGVSRGAATSPPLPNPASFCARKAISSFERRIRIERRWAQRLPHGNAAAPRLALFFMAISFPALTGLLPNSLRALCGDLPRPLPGSTVLAARFRWRRAKGACHRLPSGTPPACSLCGRVVVIPVKPALGNRP